jgi:hypothetical protein
MTSIVTAFSSWASTSFRTSCASGSVISWPGERGVGDEPDQRPLELPDVRLDLAGDVDGDVVGQRHRLGLGLLLENRDLRLEIRRLDVGDEAPFEARPQPLLESRDLVRRAVAADDDLLLRVVQRVERVEELPCVPSLPARNWMSSTSSTSTRPVALAEVDRRS